MQPDIIDKLRPYLSVKVNKQNIIKLEALRFELAEAGADALELLLTKRKQMLWPREKEFTELDRKTRLDGDVAVLERNYEFLKELQLIVKDRIEFYKVISIG